MRNVRVLSGLVALTLFLVGAGAVRAADEPLPTNPALVRGALDNGFTYLIRKHGNPPGRVSIWLHVASGSFNETDATRGLAPYLEHMAFNGSAHPGGRIHFWACCGAGLYKGPPRDPWPRPLPRAHGLQRLGQLPARLPDPLLPIAWNGLRPRPECLHGFRADHVSARPARYQARDHRQRPALPLRRGHASEPHS